MLQNTYCFDDIQQIHPTFDTKNTQYYSSEVKLIFSHQLQFNLQLQKKSTMQLIIFLVILSLLYFLYRYYFRPKAEMKRYQKILKNQGYKIYMHDFAFMNISSIEANEIGLKLHRDVHHLSKTVYPQFDIVIGNYIDKVQILILHPDLIKQFFSMNHCYRKEKSSIQIFQDHFGNGLLFSQGEEWKLKKKLLSKVFSYELLKENIPKINQICNKSFDICEEKYETKEKTYQYFLNKVGSKMFNGVTMKCFFNYDSLNDKIDGLFYDQFMTKLLQETFELSQSLMITLLGEYALKTRLTSNIRIFYQSLKIMKRKILQIIRKRTDQIKNQPIQQVSTDFLQAIYYEKIKNQKEFTLNQAELIGQLNTFLLAGTETITRYFTMIIYYLGRNPRVLQRLREEIMSVIKAKEDINHENLKKLTYFQWVQFETTRLFDVSNGIFQRIAIQDHFIKEVPISKNTIVVTQPIGNCYSQKYFKNPQEFRPQRWENECDSLHPYVFMGFGGRPRVCIGKQLAYLSTKIAVVNFILRYESFEVPEKITMNLNFLYQPQPFDTIMKKK